MVQSPSAILKTGCDLVSVELDYRIGDQIDENHCQRKESS